MLEHLHEDRIYMLKLNTGEQLVAKVVEKDEQDYRIKVAKPHIITTVQHQGHAVQGLAPWMTTLTWVAGTAIVAYSQDLPNDVRNAYIQGSTGISVARGVPTRVK